MSNTITIARNEDDFQARPPRRATTNLSVDFIESSISLAEDSCYVAETNRFVPLEDAETHEEDIRALWKEALAERDKLESAIQQLREKTRSKSSKKEIEKTTAMNWKQVVAEVNTATETYKKSAFAKICDRSGIFEQWLSLLPSDSYSSAISGAFVMGVQATRNISGIHKGVYEALASIPDVLEHAGTYVEIYQAHRNAALVKKTANLCKAILITLRLVIEFITQGSFKRITGAIIKGSDYQMALKDSMDDMKLQALRVREEASVCLQTRIAEMDRKSDEREKKAELRSKQERFSHVLAKEQLSLEIEGVPEATAQMVLDKLLNLMQSNPGYNLRTGGPPQLLGLLALEDQGTSPQPTPEPQDEVTIDSLLTVLDFDPDFLQEDMQYCLALGFAETPKFQDRAAWVLKAPETGRFLGIEPGLKVLLVHGNHDGTQFISPLSYACAKVTDLMSVSEAVICLTYFCGRHTDEWREPEANAQGLLAQLTGQLLEQISKRKDKKAKADLSSLTDTDQSGMENSDLSATWRVFEAIVKQLPKGTIVFCFIDGLAAYENSARRQKTGVLMKKMCGLMRKTRNVDVRCMVTYPGRSNYSESWGIEFDGRRAAQLEVPEQT